MLPFQVFTKGELFFAQLGRQPVSFNAQPSLLPLTCTASSIH